MPFVRVSQPADALNDPEGLFFINLDYVVSLSVTNVDNVFRVTFYLLSGSTYSVSFNSQHELYLFLKRNGVEYDG